MRHTVKKSNARCKNNVSENTLIYTASSQQVYKLMVFPDRVVYVAMIVDIVDHFCFYIQMSIEFFCLRSTYSTL